MPEAKFADNPHYREYEGLLIQLHRLFREGKEDAPEADALRDQMDVSGSWLSRDEMDRLGGLSGDLYLLDDDEVFGVITDRGDIRGWRVALEQAQAQGKWDHVLGLLRKRPTELHPAYVAWMRYRAYAALGHWKAAAEFVDFCYQLRPQNALLWEYFRAMEQAGREADALQAGLSSKAEGAADLFWLLQYVRLLEATEGLAVKPVEHYQHAAGEMGRILDQIEHSGGGGNSDEAVAWGYFSVSLCEVALRNLDAARTACVQALSRASGDPVLRRALQELQQYLTPRADEIERHISHGIIDQLNRAPSPPSLGRVPERVGA